MASISTKSELANKVLLLEKDFQKGTLTPEQEEEWRNLIIKLLSQFRSDNEKRKNTRFPSTMKTVIKFGDDIQECTVEDLSYFGLSVKGKLSTLTEKMSVTVSKIVVAGKTHELNLACDVIWKKKAPRARLESAGLKIKRNNSHEQKRSFFEVAYYPMYLHFLEEVASTPHS